ncbi:ribose 5-phosphate isomerase B [Candidatus Pacearchaeota archaeon]|nr:ribose 5-phosphate isomerase B [Candidatus Pacearchaeota archaeon]|tara:strand:- start:4803 stop:5645 length:843 start_codon:yes stop_codon:yes gene_type:complete
MKTIVLAADHNGVELKKILYEHLKSNGYRCIDLGPDGTNSVDYTDYAYQLGSIVDKRDADFGILICGTGVGMSIAVNRFKNVRGSLVHNLETAPLTREHNDSNVICLGSWITTEKQSLQIVDAWLSTPFGEGRHVKRVEKISEQKPNKIVFINGCFDILHTGHIGLLRFAKTFGDRLIVAINSDESIKKLKGDDRPINSENDRKAIIQSIDCVDEAVIFDETDPKKIRESINPDVVVRGGEFTADEIRNRDGIDDDVVIKIFPLVGNKSTANVIEKIKIK